jgi:ABC-type antimicrobial peptide transport system permease subunit
MALAQSARTTRHAYHRFADAQRAADIVAAAVAVGVPIGLVAGQLAWRRFAASLGIAADSGMPVRALALVLAGALALGALAGFVPAFLAARARPAEALRAA